MRNSMREVREIAREKGILSVEKFRIKTDLIRIVQLAEGHEPCFNSGKDCSGGFCMWAEDCGSARHANSAGISG